MGLSFYKRIGDGDFLTIGLWALLDNPYAEVTDPGNVDDAGGIEKWSLNDQWRNIANAITDIHTGLAMTAEIDEPSDAGEPLETLAGLWVNEGEDRLHFKNVAGVDKTLAYLDEVMKLDFMESVKAEIDFNAEEPSGPAIKDRYIMSEETDVGLYSTQTTFTQYYVYQLFGFTDDTCDTTNGSPSVTVDDTGSLAAGQLVTGTGIPGDTIVKSVDSSTAFTLGDNAGADVNATATNTDETLTFKNWIEIIPTDGATAFNEALNLWRHFDGTSWGDAGSLVKHDDLTDISGGAAGDIWHMTQAQHDTLTDGSNADALHIHSIETVACVCGENIDTGESVYVSGASGGKPQVHLADNTVIIKSHFYGIAIETKTTGQTIAIVPAGSAGGLNTSGISAVGAVVYLSTAGAFTSTIPTSGEVVHIGHCTVKDASVGSIEVYHHQVHTWGAAAAEDLILRMGDAIGAKKVYFKDYADATVASIDSDGTGTFINLIISQNSDTVTHSHDGTNAVVTTSDGGFKFTNSEDGVDMTFDIIGMGTGLGSLSLDGTEVMLRRNGCLFIGNTAGNRTFDTGEVNDVVCVGQHTGAAITTANHLTAIGSYAGAGNTTGDENTFLGASAGAANTTADKNTFIGTLAGSSNITGASNVFLGYNAGTNATHKDVSNQLVIANTGTVTPLLYGTFPNTLFRVQAASVEVVGGDLYLDEDKAAYLGDISLIGQDDYTHDFIDGDINVGNDTIGEVGHGFSDGDIIILTTTGVLPAGLALATKYYVVNSAADTYKVELTNGGGAVDITAAAGGGTHTATLQPVLSISDDIRIPDGKRMYFGSDDRNYIDAGAAGAGLNIFAKTANGLWGNSLSGGYWGIDGSGLWFEPASGEQIQMAADYANVLVGIGTGSPAGKVHIDQSVSDAAIPVLVLDQADEDDGFINFIGSDRGTGTLGTVNQTASVRVELGGVVYRLALYADA